MLMRLLRYTRPLDFLHFSTSLKVSHGHNVAVSGSARRESFADILVTHRIIPDTEACHFPHEAITGIKTFVTPMVTLSEYQVGFVGVECCCLKEKFKVKAIIIIIIIIIIVILR